MVVTKCFLNTSTRYKASDVFINKSPNDGKIIEEGISNIIFEQKCKKIEIEQTENVLFPGKTLLGCIFILGPRMVYHWVTPCGQTKNTLPWAEKECCGWYNYAICINPLAAVRHS